MSIKAILYDLDGTLVDSMTDIADSMNRVLDRAGHPTHSVEDYRWFIGDGLDVLVERVLPEADRRPNIMDTILNEIRVEYDAHWHDKSHPYAGIPELLSRCRDRGLIQAVLTNKPHEPAMAMLDHFDLAPFFTVIHGARSDRPIKPDPTMALSIAETCGVAPAECLFLGDMPVDMKTAAAAGMVGVGAMWGLRSAQDLADAGARVLFQSPGELMAWL